MDTVECVARRWGNSIGITLPNEVVEREHIRPNEKVIVTIGKRADLLDLFGKFKFRENAQEIKDRLREEHDY